RRRYRSVGRRTRRRDVGVAARAELRLSIEAALAEVDAFVLFLLGDSDAEHELDREPRDERGYGHPREDRHETEELRAEARIAIRQADREHTPDADDAVHGDRADGIVDLEDPIERDDRRDDEQPAD